MLKYGVLTFGYEGFGFDEELKARGFFTTNIGDNIQSVAIRRLLKLIGYSDDQIISVNRDTITLYRGDPVLLVMNGCFWERHFPIPSKVHPVFIGFQTNRETIRANKRYFEHHQPIGCRDQATYRAFRKEGIQAYVTGCLTFTLPARDKEPSNGKVFVAYGKGPGALPFSIFKHMPVEMLDRLELFNHRHTVLEWPLNAKRIDLVEKYSESVFQMFCRRADLIITPLHHVAAPAIAAGIPVIIARESHNSRFTYIKNMTEIYVPGTFDKINWSPAPKNISSIKAKLYNLVRKQLREKHRRIRNY